MSTKIDIAEVIESLKRVAKLDPKTLVAVETDLEKKVEELATEKGSEGPKAKNAFVIVLLDPEDHVRGDVTGFVTQIPESEDAGTVLDRLHKAAYEFNSSPKRRGVPITNLGDIGRAKRKHTKNAGVMLKTKEPVRVLVSNGPIPTA